MKYGYPLVFMSANARVIEIVEELKALGKVRDYKHFADTIGVSKSFISDLKAERKKVSVEVLHSMKKEYPDIDLTYIITGIKSSEKTLSTPSADINTLMLIDRVQEMAEEIGALKYQLKEAKTAIRHLEENSQTDRSVGDFSTKTAGDVKQSTDVPSSKRSVHL